MALKTYSIVVATRNRADVLATSLELFLGQSVLPAEVVVVDASDDHERVCALVRSVFAEAASPVPLTVLRADEGNLAAQRNQGLAGVTTPIVMYPDDDSYWYPDTAAALLDVYSADRAGAIGGVTAVEVGVSPVPGAAGPKRRFRLSHVPRLRWWRHRLEAALAPPPFHVYGAARTRDLAEGFADAGHFRLVETMGGYRMSFRTDVLRRLGGFDPALGRHVGYAQHEDKDMCLRVLENGLLLAAARGARVFHNVHPAPRTKGGFEYGFCQILNYAYIVCKVTRPGDSAERALGRYCHYKTWSYGLRWHKSGYLREIALGAQAAMGELPALRAAPRQKLTEAYLAAMDRHLGFLLEAKASR